MWVGQYLDVGWHSVPIGVVRDDLLESGDANFSVHLSVRFLSGGQFNKIVITTICYFMPPFWRIRNFLIVGRATRGRCYAHNFPRFLPIFVEKFGLFSQKTNVMIKFLHNLALFWVKNAIFFADFFHNIGPRLGENRPLDSPVGWLFRLGSFKKITELPRIFKTTFTQCTSYGCIYYNNKWVGLLLGDFFTNSSGVDVMITIFCDFWQFSAKKLAFFSKTDVMINFFQNLALLWAKNANFLLNFSAKIF
jgi:hypothetical protein